MFVFVFSFDGCLVRGPGVVCSLSITILVVRITSRVGCKGVLPSVSSIKFSCFCLPFKNVPISLLGSFPCSRLVLVPVKFGQLGQFTPWRVHHALQVYVKFFVLLL